MKIDAEIVTLLQRIIELLEERSLPTPPTYILGVWNDWSGGEPPVAADVLVDIRIRHGAQGGPAPAENYNWAHGSYGRYGERDILRFRIVSDEENAKRKEAVLNKGPSEASLDNCDFGDSVLAEEFAAKYESPSGSHSASMPGSEQEEHGGRNA